MGEIAYRCIECGLIWGESVTDEKDISGAYCPRCVRSRLGERIRKNVDCFDNGWSDCKVITCEYRFACQVERTGYEETYEPAREEPPVSGL